MTKRAFTVTRLFIGGLLEGLYFTEQTDVKREVGQVVACPVAGSPYKIVGVVKNSEAQQ